MRKDRHDTEEAEVQRGDQVDEEKLSAKEIKKRERMGRVEKRRKARQKDKVARFAGIILLGMVLIIGFLLWVSGEMR